MNTVRRRSVDVLHRTQQVDRSPSPPSDGGEEGGPRYRLDDNHTAMQAHRPLLAAREAAHENEARHGHEKRPGP
jgi:hypothetical protein